MKKLIVVLLFVLLGALAQAQTRLVLQGLDFDPYDSAQDFMTAFALEDSCHNVTLTRLCPTGKVDSCKFSRLDGDVWTMTASDVSDLVPKKPIFWRLERRHNLNIATEFHGNARSERAAAKVICSIISGRGGKVQ